jgi:hypothetical protein
VGDMPNRVIGRSDSGLRLIDASPAEAATIAEALLQRTRQAA